ncbi:hypothetical protein V1514DRAFT_324267 [Lipomyces japonicus]|uniref:uncharacterized protein n=1 Tax=Lipomyces japonicus TaxID=56871 RepID=UPI0034CD30E0
MNFFRQGSIRALRNCSVKFEPLIVRSRLSRFSLNPSVTFTAARRHISYSSSQTVNRPGFFSRKTLIRLGLVFGGLGVAAWALFPSSKYPDEATNLIRKGLLEERRLGFADDKAEHGKILNTALQYYVAALQVCERLGVERTSVEFTGLQVKIAEVLERSDRLSEAAVIYASILQNGILFLQEDPRRVGAMDDERILRYLQVAVRVAEITEDMNHGFQAVPVLGMWIQSLQSRLPDNYKSLLLTPIMDIETDIDLPLQPYSLPDPPSENELKSFNHIEDEMENTLALARDYYGTLVMEGFRSGVGGKIKMENIRLLQFMSAPLPRILRSQVDIGSAYFLAYEIATNDLENNPDKPEIWRSSLSAKADTYLDIAWSTLHSVLQQITDLRNKGRRSDLSHEDFEDLDIAHSLAVFGLGVVEGKRGNYERAIELLHEARVRARGSEFPELGEKAKEEIKIVLDKVNEQTVKGTTKELHGAIKAIVESTPSPPTLSSDQ